MTVDKTKVKQGDKLDPKRTLDTSKIGAETKAADVGITGLSEETIMASHIVSTKGEPEKSTKAANIVSVEEQSTKITEAADIVGTDKNPETIGSEVNKDETGIKPFDTMSMMGDGCEDIGGYQPFSDGDQTDSSLRKELYSQHLVTSFRPFRILLLLFGRLPLQYSYIPEDGTYVFSSSWCHPYGLYFLITSLLIFYILLVGTWNLFIVLMNVDIEGSAENSTAFNESQLEREYDKVVIQRHFVTFVVIWTALIHSAVATISILLKRQYMVNYFGFWTRAVSTMQMDIAKGTFQYAIVCCGLFIVMIAVLAVLTGFHVGPSTIGGPTVFAILMFRHYLSTDWLYDVRNNPPEINHTTRTIWQILGGSFLIYIFVASKAYIFMFLYKCKLLRNAFANWNGRVYAAILKGGSFTHTVEGRTTYSLLFKDHCILLDLIEGTDHLFSTIVESYSGLQVCSICFELYFFIRTARYGSKQHEGAEKGLYFIRPDDWAPALVILLQSVLILLVVSKAAAEVGEEAMAGLEVIRRKTMLGRKTDEELYFMLSMFSSYTAYKSLGLSGGGYFYLDKEFVIGIISTMFSYFIILYQFQPPLDYKTDKPNVRQRVGEFLVDLEKLEKGHWQTTSEPPLLVNHY